MASAKEGFFTRRSPAFWMVFGGDIFLAFWLVLCAGMFFSSGKSESESALLDGQRYIIDVASGKLKGKLQPEKPKASEDRPSSLPAPDGEADVAGESNTDPTKRDRPMKDKFSEFDVADGVSPDDANVNLSATMVQPVDEPVTLLPRTVNSLNEAPSPELSEDSSWGPIPRTGQIGSPKSYYSRAFIDEARPHIAIVITDLGTSKSLIDKVLALPADITLVFNPYPKHVADWVHNARTLGHETWLQLPMQPKDFPASDPGPLALLKDIAPEENMERLHRLMATFPGFVGVVFPRNESFTESDEQLRKIADEIFMRGIGLLYPDPKLNEELKKEQVRRSDSLLTATAIIDDTLTPAGIESQLRKLEQDALRDGFALGIAHAYPLSIDMIAKWSTTLKEKKILLAPASALFKH